MATTNSTSSLPSGIVRYEEYVAQQKTTPTKTAMGQTEFLTLFTTQLKNQDPTDPVKNEAFVAQLAQFSQLEASTAMRTSMDKLVSTLANDRLLGATSLIGKTVGVPDGPVEVTDTTVSQGTINLPTGADGIKLQVFNDKGVLIRTQILGAQPVGDVTLVRSGAGFHVLKLVTKRASSVVTVTQTHPRHILLRPGGQLSQTAARAQLAEYKRQIETGKADFAKLAKEHSQDGSAAEGGDLGWVSAGMFVPEFEEVMNKLQPGQIADPLVSRFGVHLVQVLARREAPITERELRDLVRNTLREKKYDETYQLWAQEVRGRAYIEYRDPPL